MFTRTLPLLRPLHTRPPTGSPATPPQAAKIAGKRGFAGSHLWDKIGRCFIRSFSERQYAKTFSSELNEAVMFAIVEWMKIIHKVVPRSLVHGGSEDVEVIVYTDGY